jgi:Spx/MgsR family transcriptional regulator
MITIYGIKTCNSVRKAIKFCKDNNLEYQFHDFRAQPLEDSKIDLFASQIDINTLFNSRGTKYKDLKLKELNLDEKEKVEWLKKENMLLKRPVVEYNKDNNQKILVAFDEAIYKEKLL